LAGSTSGQTLAFYEGYSNKRTVADVNEKKKKIDRPQGESEENLFAWLARARQGEQCEISPGKRPCCYTTRFVVSKRRVVELLVYFYHNARDAALIRSQAHQKANEERREKN
jgi:hypothetical protein